METVTVRYGNMSLLKCIQWRKRYVPCTIAYISRRRPFGALRVHGVLPMEGFRNSFRVHPLTSRGLPQAVADKLKQGCRF